jgi:hypothetical protein
MILVQSTMQHHMQLGGTSLIPSHTNVTSPYTQPLSTSSGNSTHAMSQNAKSQQQPKAHCVVWAAPGKAPAADLMQALARRSELRRTKSARSTRRWDSPTENKFIAMQIMHYIMSPKIQTVILVACARLKV